MLEIRLEGTTRLDSLGRRLRVATEKQMYALTDLLYQKVLENLSGKVLERRRGQLMASIQQDVDVQGDVYQSMVYPIPADAKAWALEVGGKGYYSIVPTKASILHFFAKSGDEVFTTHVNHPPSEAFGYLRRAYEEVLPKIPEGFREYIQMALDAEAE